MLSVSIIGVGKMGGALALALDREGFRIEKLIGKTNESSLTLLPLLNSKPLVSTEIGSFDSDVTFITTQDSEIENAARQFEPSNKIKQIVFHTSGSLSSKILEILRERGYETGSIHPLVSISEPSLGATRFANAFFAIEGSETAQIVAQKIVAALSGKPFTIDSKHKTLYHASAVASCGHIVALFSTAIEMLSSCGLNREESQNILFPLLKSTVENLSVQSPENAITGTFARLDQEILENQITEIRGNLSPEILDIFLGLALQSLKLNAIRSPQRLEKIEKMKQTILIAKNVSGC